MNAEAWNKWFAESFDNHVKAALDAHMEFYADVIAETIVAERRAMREHIDKELGQLRAQIEILTKHKANKDVVLIRSRDVA